MDEMRNKKIMKHRLSETEDGRKGLKALEECTKNGSQTLDLSRRNH